MVEMTHADDDSIDIEQFRPMSRIEVSRRELTDDEIREIRKQAQKKIHTEGLSGVSIKNEQFPLSVRLIQSMLMRPPEDFDFAYADSIETKQLEFTDSVTLNDNPEKPTQLDTDGTRGLVTIHIETIPDSNEIESITVEASLAV